MAFAPLPDDFLQRLSARPGAPVLELGCADGRFCRVLAEHGADPWGLDLTPPARGSAARIVGDACHPPLRPGRWPLVVAANLVRHLAPARSMGPLLARWLELLAPGGALYVLEDGPGGATAQARHFETLQELLAGLPGRGPLLSRDSFRRELEGHAVVAAAGQQENRYPLDAGAVVAMLQAGAPAAGTPAAELAEAIARDGVACGSYWWMRLEPPVR